MQKAIAILSVVSIFAAAPMPALAETGVTDTEITFGSCVPLSGGNKINGVAYSNGAKAYFGYVNAEKGGINGRKVKFVLNDDGYDAEKAIACYKQLIDGGVFATGLGIGTPTAAKYVLMAENNKIPYIANAGGPSLMISPLRKYVFAVRTTYAEEIRAGVSHIWNDLGLHKIAVIYQNDALGASVLGGLKEALSPLGGQIVAEGAYPRNTTDIDAAYATVKAANPDVVYIGGVTVPMGAVLKKAKADGWKPLFVPLPARDLELIKVAGDATEGIVIGNAVPLEGDEKLPTIALYKRSMRKYVPGAEASGLSLLGFVDALVAGEGMKRAGKDLTRDGLVSALEGMSDVDVGLGPDFKVTYGPQDHEAFHTVAFSTIKGGKVIPMKDWKADLGR